MARLSKKQKEAQRTESLVYLASMVKPGDTVYTILRSVSRSGMSRVISLLIVHNGEIRDITGYATDILGWRDTGDGLRVNGVGMDAGFHAVYSLSAALFPDGFVVTDKYGRNGDTSGFDKDGGYALKHRWL